MKTFKEIVPGDTLYFVAERHSEIVMLMADRVDHSTISIGQYDYGIKRQDTTSQTWTKRTTVGVLFTNYEQAREQARQNALYELEDLADAAKQAVNAIRQHRLKCWDLLNLDIGEHELVRAEKELQQTI